MPEHSKPLEIIDLTRRYGDLVAVHRLRLDVRPGEILGFLGPNGAGKTTTLRVCAGLLRPDEGQVTIAGASLLHEPVLARSRLGFVPDRPFLYERLSAREFLDFVAALYDVEPGTALRRIDGLLERLDLAAVADDLVETYSHGMRQKTSIAAALVHDPPLIMLDEPLSGLDPKGARVLKDLLRERAARGLGVLVSTLLFGGAGCLWDRVVSLHGGEKRAEGSLSELRGERRDATLEDVFLELTREEVP